MKLQREEVVKADEFKYLGSAILSSGQCRRECRQGAVSGIISYISFFSHRDRKVYKMIGLMYGLETVALTNKIEG